MAVRTFAAIDVGSFELSMKIYEISAKGGMKEINHVRHRLALGTDSYRSQKIGYGKIDELCRVLREFQEIMKEYQVTDYKAYGTSAIRETENTMIILDQIRIRTGINVEVLSNSEQRFLDYKSVASKGAQFRHIIEKGTAIVDIGGGNIQISLFDNDTLFTTQNLRLGVLRLHEMLVQMRVGPSQMKVILAEMIDSQVQVFRKMYMKDRKVNHLIVVDDYISGIVRSGAFESGNIKKMIAGENVALVNKNFLNKEGLISADDFSNFSNLLFTGGKEVLAEELGIPEENVELLAISAKLVESILRLLEIDAIWVPGVTLCDGIAYEYAEKKKINIIEHDFEKDILACARNISKRYMGSRKRSETLEEISLTIFDSLKKIHGMGKRERFLLELSAILHDCGKFINMTNVGECSFNIIMNTEIIGLSHAERQLVAYVVKFNHDAFEYYDKLAATSDVTREDYLTISKLTAILRVANGLDKSHKDKFKKIKAQLQEEKLILTVDASLDILYEQEMFRQRADFFAEVFSIRPVIRQKAN